jgi:hypothetical protein
MRQAGSAERSARRAGPRPSRVHARATGNARRHGLTVPIRLDPRWRAAVVALERTLVREAPTARAFAGRAAEGVVELRRIAQARAAFIGAFEGEATLDLLRRLDRYESLAYAKKDKALRVIAAHRLVRDCAEALRCCSKVAIRKSSAREELRDPETSDTAVRPASGGDELDDRARRLRHPAHPRPPRGAQRQWNRRARWRVTDAPLTLGADKRQSVAVPWGAGVLRRLRSQICGGAEGERRPLFALNFPEGDGEVPRGPMGPARPSLSKPAVCRGSAP